MSKKNKNKNKNQPSAPQRHAPISMADVKNLFSPLKDTIESAPAISSNDGSATVTTPPKESLLDKIKSLVPSEKKLSDDEKNILDTLQRDLKVAIDLYNMAKKDCDGVKADYNAKIANLGKTAKDQEDKARKLEEKKGNLDKRETGLNERLDKLDDRESKLNTLKNEVDQKEAENKKESERLNKLDAEIKQREAEANAGFIANETRWKNEITEKLNKDLQSTRESLQKQINEYQEEKASLYFNQQKCILEKTEYENKKKAFDDVKAEIRDDYKRELEQRKSDYNAQITELTKEKESLLCQLKSYKDIKSQLDGMSAEEAKELINSLRIENEKLKLERNTLWSPEHQQQMQDDLETFKDKYEAAIAEKNALFNQMMDYRRKIVDNDGLIAYKNTLETHNKALKAAQDQLREELNELTKKDKNKDIFAEFKNIDSRCNHKYISFTQKSGDLKDFVNAVGYQLTQYQPNLFYTRETLQLFVGGLAMSRLILLQGISGTGKTKLAQAFASIVGDNSDGRQSEKDSCSYIIPVQAGWRDNQDLLGYYNAFEKKFYEKPFSKGLYTASTPQFRNRLFFLILDEMNLSHPEQYFADFISAMEQANSSIFDNLKVELLSGMPKEIMESDRWPMHLENEKIIVPPNVWFIGTANHDETTMEFADKTYDRAHVMVMERNTQKTSYDKVGKGSAHWSAEDLRNAFVEAQESSEGEKQSDWVTEKLHSLKDILKSEFDVSFGNRLERQIRDFVPVVCAAGGTEELALDHLLATKIVRKGKITGLFGVQEDSLVKLKDEIQKNIKLGDDSATIKLLDQDIAAKRRGA
ncbi:MAG: hypothetical protein IK012_05035 [Fibrobacter sp.]|uniref:hypothetical protein n=1 Tax=Fibrobacter sp. TaxID=35828 RepID=UPI0025BA339D|nr:hypothetical protein [Fibrobacter sp.]MBR4784604.1 hypothetical protein [Fibrobacter sp.]